MFYITDTLSKQPSVPTKIRNLALKLEPKKLEILQVRADAEIWVGFASVIVGVFGSSSLIYALLYWQYVRMRYMLNAFSKTSFAYLRYKGDVLFAKTPAIVNKGWIKLKDLCDWVNNMEAQQSSSCEIF